MTYLILRFSTLGNVAMTVPVVASLSRLQPKDKFIIVSQKRLHGMFYGMDNVRFLEVDFKDGCLKSIWRLFHELRAFSPDMIIDLQNIARTRLLRYLFRFIGVPSYTIKNGCTEKKLVTLFGKSYTISLPHESIRYAETCQRAGLKTDNDFISLPVNQEALQQVTQLFGQKEGQWIGIAPFAKSKSNMLPYKTMKEVISHYAVKPDTRIFLFGAGNVETQMLRQWASLYPNVESVAGMLPIESELELMRQLEGMICMDSANQHLCSLVNLRAVSIWCATHPKTGFYGYKQNEQDMVQLNTLSCRPCTIHGKNKCRFRNFACKDIMPMQIYETFEQ